ncbi:hypothetical protein BCY84_07682 [Trypanosoma cruzi cruzi]|nr:hypothetical protein BCY84_07682 [Trypanosoma cruzi cruzi]
MAAFSAVYRRGALRRCTRGTVSCRRSRLRIPSEYDMLFFMDSAADVTGVVAALQSATRDGASGRGDGGALRLVEATEALSVAAYCLERPKGFERGMRGTFGWLIGSVGDVPAAGMDHDALRPFVSANAKGPVREFFDCRRRRCIIIATVVIDSGGGNGASSCGRDLLARRVKWDAVPQQRLQRR